MSPELEKCPRSLLVCEKSNFLNEKSRHDIHVSKHSFNYKVSLIIKHLLNILSFQLCLDCIRMPLSPQISVLIPECGTLPANISGVLHSFSTYYVVRDLPVHHLLEETFLESLVKKGRRRNMLLYISFIFAFVLVLNQIVRFFLIFLHRTLLCAFLQHQH